MILASASVYLISTGTMAETNIINNYPSNAQQQVNNCPPPPESTPGQPKQGVTYQSNPRGGMDIVYSTGEKKPYYVDQNCNNNNYPAVIQPVIPTTIIGR